jgi:hypothetical protein
MIQQKHNPGYKLIEIDINNKKFVYGETNSGENKGLEVYYFKSQFHTDFHYSRRYNNERLMPMIYNELYIKLKSIINNCLPGCKVYLSTLEFKNIQLQNAVS